MFYPHDFEVSKNSFIDENKLQLLTKLMK